MPMISDPDSAMVCDELYALVTGYKQYLAESTGRYQKYFTVSPDEIRDTSESKYQTKNDTESFSPEVKPEKPVNFRSSQHQPAETDANKIPPMASFRLGVIMLCPEEEHTPILQVEIIKNILEAARIDVKFVYGDYLFNDPVMNIDKIGIAQKKVSIVSLMERLKNNHVSHVWLFGDSISQLLLACHEDGLEMMRKSMPVFFSGMHCYPFYEPWVIERRHDLKKNIWQHIKRMLHSV